MKSEPSERWVARLIAEPEEIDAVLAAPLGLDVWERHADALVVVASTARLDEIERRRLARVERLGAAADLIAERKREGEPPG